MSPQPTVTQIRLNNILHCLTVAVSTLDALSNSVDTPFLAAISNTTRSLLTSLQTVRQHRNDCIQMMEQVHKLHYAIIGLHLPAGGLSPNLLKHLGKFTE
ncbi:hypothetical protein C8R44DRAFT_873736 [Mycena epipterygia]|nr:hypothetical protein C8R44DRAFT_873736 [Mycena epipterygia]